MKQVTMDKPTALSQAKGEHNQKKSHLTEYLGLLSFVAIAIQCVNGMPHFLTELAQPGKGPMLQPANPTAQEFFMAMQAGGTFTSKDGERMYSIPNLEKQQAEHPDKIAVILKSDLRKGELKCTDNYVVRATNKVEPLTFGAVPENVFNKLAFLSTSHLGMTGSKNQYGATVGAANVKLSP